MYWVFNKKGELTSAQIIALVLAIIGFAVILAFIYGFQGSVNTSDDVCKFSVVGRATAQNIVGGAGQYVPLKCTTKKICITDKLFGGSCSQFTGEQDVQTVRLSGTDSQKVDTIEEISANAMYDCWNMMGQGKLDLFSTIAKQAGFNTAAPTCVICSRVAIDDNVIKDHPDYFDAKSPNSIDMRTYLATHQVPGSSLTYLQTFTDAGVNAFPAVDQSLIRAGTNNVVDTRKVDLQKAVADAQTQINSATDAVSKQAAQAALADAQANLDAYTSSTPASISSPFTRNEIAIVFMQLKSVKFTDAFDKQISWGIAAAGTSAFISPGKTAAAVSAVFTPGGLITTLSLGAVDAGIVALNTFEGQKNAGIYCGSFTSAEKASEGCSVVQTMPYSFDAISKLCTSIQGNP